MSAHETSLNKYASLPIKPMKLIELFRFWKKFQQKIRRCFTSCMRDWKRNMAWLVTLWLCTTEPARLSQKRTDSPCVSLRRIMLAFFDFVKIYCTLIELQNSLESRIQEKSSCVLSRICQKRASRICVSNSLTWSANSEKSIELELYLSNSLYFIHLIIC